VKTNRKILNYDDRKGYNNEGEIRNNKVKSNVDGFFFFVQCNIFVNILYIGSSCLQIENIVNKNVKQ
jgi:hypothetical protein